MSNKGAREMRALPNGWFMKESDGVDGEYTVEGVYGTRYTTRRYWLLKLEGYAVLYWIAEAECKCMAAIAEFKQVMRWKHMPRMRNVEHLHPDLLKEQDNAAPIQPSDEAVTDTGTYAPPVLEQDHNKNTAVVVLEDGPIGWLTESEDSEPEEQSRCIDHEPSKPKRSKSMTAIAAADEKSSDDETSDDDSSMESSISSSDDKQAPNMPPHHALGSIPQRASSIDVSKETAALEPKPYKLLDGLRVVEVTGIIGEKPHFEAMVVYEDGSEECVPFKLLRHHNTATMDILVDFYEDNISL